MTTTLKAGLRVELLPFILFAALYNRKHFTIALDLYRFTSMNSNEGLLFKERQPVYFTPNNSI